MLSTEFAGLVYVIVMLLVQQTIESSDYIVKVTPTCPAKVTKKNFATIKILTDLPETLPTAYCKGSEDYNFEIALDGMWELKVYFAGDVKKQCVFEKKSGVEFYSVQVEVPEAIGLLTANSAPHLVSCTYDPTGTKDSGKSSFSDGLQPVKEIQQHMSTVSKSDVKLCAADIQNNCIQGKIRLGKTIKLKAELVGNFKDEKSFQALSCKAVGVASSYAILVGGCGDGVIFPKSSGFTTTGRSATSPFFKSFRLPGSSKINFDCTFIVCPTVCEGSSCSHAKRKKRSAEERYIKKQISFSSELDGIGEGQNIVKSKVRRISKP